MKGRLYLSIRISFIAFLLVAFYSICDEVGFKNGVILNNVEVLKETPEEVIIMTESSKIVVPRSKIEYIKKEPIGKVNLYLENAKRMMEKGAYEEALFEIRKARALEPNNRKVLELYNRIIELKNKKLLEKFEKQYLIGYKLESTGNYKEARKFYEKLLTSKNISIFPSLCHKIKEHIYICNKELAKSILNSSIPTPLQLKECKEYLLSAQRYKKDDAEVYFYMGKLEEFLGHIEQAKKNYQQSLLLNPSMTQAKEALINLNLVKNVASKEKQINMNIKGQKPLKQKSLISKNFAQSMSSIPKNYKREKNFWEKIKVYIRNRKYKNFADFILYYIDKYFVTIIIIILVIFVGWILPIVHFRQKALIYESFLRYQKYVIFLGIFTYILILFEKIFKNVKFSLKKTGIVCPSCKASLDDLYIWKDFDFKSCPFCGYKFIKIVIDPKEFLIKLSEDVSEKLSENTSAPIREALEKDTINYLLNAILSIAIDLRSTDVHLEPFSNVFRIRHRVDGVLYNLVNLPIKIHPNVTSAIKILANLDISEKRIPQDGKFKYERNNKKYDIRVSTIPTQYGEKISLRILSPSDVVKTLNSLGMDEDDEYKVKTSIGKNYGLILTTGPTGSGKTTTLYTIMQSLNTGEKNIVTLEDPIEYELPGITQMQVNYATGFTFAAGLKSILRQDPDIIMVGEIRDLETAEIAVNAALTGHLVLSSLHTIDSIGAITRLIDMGIDPSLFASSLNLVIAQRLIRKNCPYCKRAYKPSPMDLQILGIHDASKDIVFKKGVGCEKCNGIGYLGRIGIFEVLVIDSGIRSLIEKKAGYEAIFTSAKNKGMKTLKEKGILKILKGETTVEEVIRVIGGEEK